MAHGIGLRKARVMPDSWKEPAFKAAFLAGVADDAICLARNRNDLTRAELARSLEDADAALCGAMRELEEARAMLNAPKEEQ